MAVWAVADSGDQRFEDETVIHPGAFPGTAFKMTGSQTEAGVLVQGNSLPAFRSDDGLRQGARCQSQLLEDLTDNFINKYSRQNRHLKWSVMMRSAGYLLEGHVNETA